MDREFRFELKKLRGRIIEKYGSQKNFAAALGITKNTMSRKMNGGIAITQMEIVEWAEMLEIDRESIVDYFFT